MNSVHLIGNLTRDPDRRATGNGKTATELGIAVSSTFKNEDGTYKTDFFDVMVYGKTAENCLRFLSKGKKVAIEAKLSDVHYKDQSNKPRRLLMIIANSVEFLSPSGNVSAQAAAPAEVTPDMFQDINEEDIPFN